MNERNYCYADIIDLEQRLAFYKEKNKEWTKDKEELKKVTKRMYELMREVRMLSSLIPTMIIVYAIALGLSLWLVWR